MGFEKVENVQFPLREPGRPFVFFLHSCVADKWHPVCEKYNFH